MSDSRPDPRMRVVEGDITALMVDAVVNAANEGLRPGGGVCGAIHAAAGPGLARECSTLGRCPVGEARITGGHNLPAGRVIHAVGPVWRGGDQGERSLLDAAYRNSMALATANGLKSIAFPAISTGIFGYPPERAAETAIAAVGRALAAGDGIEEVIFCCFDGATAEIYRRLLGSG